MAADGAGACARGSFVDGPDRAHDAKKLLGSVRPGPRQAPNDRAGHEGLGILDHRR